MKPINFLLPKLETADDKTAKVKLVSSDSNFKDYSASYRIPSQELVSVAYALTENADFKNFIKYYRDKFSIPKSGFSYNQFKRSRAYFLRQPPKDNVILKIQLTLAWALQKKVFTAHPLIIPHLTTILCANFIEIKKDLIEIQLPTVEQNYLSMKVNYQVSFNKIIIYLKKHRAEIEESLKQLGNGEFKLKQDNVSLVSSKTPDLTYNNAMSNAKTNPQLAKRLKSLDWEDSYKKAVIRSKRKISALFSYKGQK